MKKLIIQIVIFSIIIGIAALSINTAFGNQTITYIQKIKYVTGNTQFYYYKFTWWQYIKNIELSTSDLSILVFDIPTRQWQFVNATIVQQEFWEMVANNLAVILDYIILAINIILYPLKVGAYLLKNALAILGVNQDTDNPYNGLAWLVIFVRDILSRIVIPYI